MVPLRELGKWEGKLGLMGIGERRSLVFGEVLDNRGEDLDLPT